MSLNNLYHSWQMSLMQAKAAATPEARAAHQGRADAYGALIEQMRLSGATDAPDRFGPNGRSLGQPDD